MLKSNIAITTTKYIEEQKIEKVSNFFGLFKEKISF